MYELLTYYFTFLSFTILQCRELLCFKNVIPHPICIKFLFIQYSNNPSFKFGPVLGWFLEEWGTDTGQLLTRVYLYPPGTYPPVLKNSKEPVMVYNCDSHPKNKIKQSTNGPWNYSGLFFQQTLSLFWKKKKKGKFSIF